jgi:hypothetical protein
MSLSREAREEEKRERRRSAQVRSLDGQISERRRLKEISMERKREENRDLLYLRDSLEAATTRQQKLVEAHHESEQVLHLLKWQKLHREEVNNRSSRKAAAAAAAAEKKRRIGSGRRTRGGGS